MTCCLEVEAPRRKELPQNARRAYSSDGGFSRKKSALESCLHKNPTKQIAQRYAPTLEQAKQWSVVFVVHSRVSSLEEEFLSLAKKWKSETGQYSLLHQKVLHPAYLEIIGRGEKVIPLIIREMQRGGNHWFLALRSIARENPVPNGSTFPQAVQSWVKWWDNRRSRHVRMDS